jgi:hypothetical protein
MGKLNLCMKISIDCTIIINGKKPLSQKHDLISEDLQA